MIELALIALLQAADPQPVAQGLPETTVEQVQQNDEAASQDEVRQRCQTTLETGSRIRSRRVCTDPSDPNRRLQRNIENAQTQSTERARPRLPTDR